MRISFIIACLGLSVSAISAAPAPKTVRFIYLVSSDRSHNPAYEAAIAMAARHIQGWYKKQMNGYTFRLNEPVVEVVKATKKASYFYTNPKGNDKDTWGFNNTYEEVNRLIGVKYWDADYIYVVYSDGPGNGGRGGSGVAIMPEDDLLGLIGKHPEQKEINRWIGGLGHELGHALGLPHPKDMKKDEAAIMASGIYAGRYPDIAYLTPEDKSILSKSRFLFNDAGESIAGTETEVARFTYGQGIFSRLQNSKTRVFRWQEITNERNSFEFSEKSANGKEYHLKSVDRNLEIRIPVAGGQSQISADGGRNWRNFQIMSTVVER